MDSQLTFFEELQLLLGMVDMAFPAGAPWNGGGVRNTFVLNERGNIFVTVWVFKSNGTPAAVQAEITFDNDDNFSFVDLIEELSNGAKQID